VSDSAVRTVDRLIASVAGVDTPAPADFQARVRYQVRQDAMDAAYRIMLEQGWPAVRMTAIAAAVGISRQTLYKEFGSKQEVGEALLIREAERFITGIASDLDRYDDVPGAIEAAIRYTFQHAAANPLLTAILSGAHEGGDSLLPLVTIDAEPLITLAARVLAEHITHRDRNLDTEDVAATADALARLTVSHLLRPVGDRETTVRRLSRLACRNLGLEPGHG
jgi:AcrR family transcriptional regulator